MKVVYVKLYFKYKKTSEEAFGNTNVLYRGLGVTSIKGKEKK
tara:strand:- start:112 stop:237 length:126 start_codon:yes stop_codon:yes gene_type:complete